MDWATSNHRPAPPTEPPAPTLLEPCWIVQGPSGKTITCGIYETTAPGVELRVGYTIDHLIRSQRTASRETARRLAADWLEAVRAKGGFEEVALP